MFAVSAPRSVEVNQCVTLCYKLGKLVGFKLSKRCSFFCAFTVVLKVGSHAFLFQVIIHAQTLNPGRTPRTPCGNTLAAGRWLGTLRKNKAEKENKKKSANGWHHYVLLLVINNQQAWRITLEQLDTSAEFPLIFLIVKFLLTLDWF
jgi:hypothetical protein